MTAMELPPNRIEELREEANLPRAALAVACGVGEMTIRRWERGESKVDDDQKFTLAGELSRRLGREIAPEFVMGWDRVPAGTGGAA